MSDMDNSGSDRSDGVVSVEWTDEEWAGLYDVEWEENGSQGTSFIGRVRSWIGSLASRITSDDRPQNAEECPFSFKLPRGHTSNGVHCTTCGDPIISHDVTWKICDDDTDTEQHGENDE